MMMMRRPGAPIDEGVSVIIDLPHAADHRSAQAIELRDAATHETITGVLAFSLHANANAALLNDLWLVAEQLVDEDGKPLRTGVHAATSSTPEFFQPVVHTALYRYWVAGFTTGPTVDCDTSWHPSAAGAFAAGYPSAASVGDRGLTLFEVTRTDTGSARVAATHFEFRDGFVHFYGEGGSQCAAYPAEHVRSIRAVQDRNLVVLDEDQMHTLRSSVLWDLERTALASRRGEYPEHLRSLAEHLGLRCPAPGGAAECAEAANGVDEMPDEPNERTREAARRLHDVVERR